MDNDWCLSLVPLVRIAPSCRRAGEAHEVAQAASTHRQCFMQDENVACHDLGKLSFERAVGCFGKPQLERATRFPMPQLERATRFPMSQLERATRFPNVPSLACNSLLNCQFEVCVFDCFCHSMPFICLNITN